MRQHMTIFTLTLWLCLPVAWALSGSRFIDWAYAMPDLGGVDDTILTILDRADSWRAALGLGDPFGDLRAALHHATGLGARP